MIKKCVVTHASEGDRQVVINIAQNNLDTILRDNMKQVLHALKAKMEDEGTIIFNGYAQFFYTDLDDHCLSQDWALIEILGKTLPLTLPAGGHSTTWWCRSTRSSKALSTRSLPIQASVIPSGFLTGTPGYTRA